MTLRCLIAICAVLMKNRGLSKWLRAVNGISLRAKPAPCRGEGRGRELGCKSCNHPSVNHLLPAPIMARGDGGEANPTGPWPTWGCQALPLALCTQIRGWASVSPRRSQTSCHCHIIWVHWGQSTNGFRTCFSLLRANTHLWEQGLGGTPRAHALVSSPNKLKL